MSPWFWRNFFQVSGKMKLYGRATYHFNRLRLVLYVHNVKLTHTYVPAKIKRPDFHSRTARNGMKNDHDTSTIQILVINTIFVVTIPDTERLIIT